MLSSTPLPNAENNLATSQNILPHDQLEELALELAQKLTPVPTVTTNFPLPARLKNLSRFLHSAQQYFEKASKKQGNVTQAAEWLLDNFYVIEQALRQIEEGMPADFYSRLPKLSNGQTRIESIAIELVQYSQSRLDTERIKSFIQTYQSAAPLKTGELWALDVMLRLGLLEVMVLGLGTLTGIKIEASLPRLDQTLQDLLPSTTSENLESKKTSTPSLNVLTQPSADTFVVNAILSLRLLATLDWKSFFETVSLVESILRSDPQGIYLRMDFETRNQYRSVVEELARGAQSEEFEIALAVIDLARMGKTPSEQHIGYYLIDEGRGILEAKIKFIASLGRRVKRWVIKHAAPLYLGSIAALTTLLIFVATAIAALMGANAAMLILVVLLTSLPASSIAIDLIHWLIVYVVPPRTLPKLDARNVLPPELSTVVVIPAIIRRKTDLQSLFQQLEFHYLGNNDPNIYFALLTDFTDSPQQNMPDDEKLLAFAREEIANLNQKYSNESYHPFFFFHRERTWNAGEDCWMGWERKRGKLVEFNRLLHGSKETNFIVQLGDLNVLSRIRYVITLDADTTLPRETARKLVCTLGHPLNQAEFDPISGKVTHGYTVLQPRTQVRPEVGNQSMFTRIFTGDVSLDLYTKAVSDVYQDLFGEGSYVGKGIYDATAFERSIQGRVPDNTLLSHDLFEGILGRCGLATDIVLFEDYPPHYIAYTRRLHRWVRGDWQLLPWLGRMVPHRDLGKVANDISIIDRWKIIDNLRRSLLTPAIFLLLICGWLIFPGPPIIWTFLALSPFLQGIITGLISGLRSGNTEHVPGTRTRLFKQTTLRAFFAIVFLPFETIVILDAIGTTLVRLKITRKRLLQWMTAAHTLTVFGKVLQVGVAWKEMVSAPFLSIVLLVAISLSNLSVLIVAAPILLVWMFSPYFAVRISHPITHHTEKLTPRQQHNLRLLARSTWLYFERFVSPDDHWLPPDHFQESPLGLVAHRTSPTNIGLMLLSTLSAFDLGYISAPELAVRIKNAFDAMDLLERARGHFLNWYDIRTLAPLPPRYISTVDSGNLAACLVTLRQGCVDVTSRFLIHWEGLLDTLDMLSSALEDANLGDSAIELNQTIAALRSQVEVLKGTREWPPKLMNALLKESSSEMENLLIKAIESSEENLSPETLQSISTWMERTRHHLSNIQRDLQTLCPWVLAMADLPAYFGRSNLSPEITAAWSDLQAIFTFRPPLEDIAAINLNAMEKIQSILTLIDRSETETIKWCEDLVSNLKTAHEMAISLMEDFADISVRAEEYCQAMSFSFLFDPQRQVFHIGYNVDSGRLDSNYYDMLASECRIASLIAIARGDVPQSHWLYLARPLTQWDETRMLLSWSGTMFEYLMPTLIVEGYRGTLLEQTCHAAVEHQIDYARKNQIPWGISESSYYFFDAGQIYQYRAFGVPGLGYKRGLADDLVVTPYASILALPFAQQAVMQNLDHFKKLKMLGLYGLYESIDYTTQRIGAGQEYAIIRSYMAHHQGMILLAVSNQLLKRRMVRRFHSDLRIQSVELLLHEQTPDRAPIEHPHPQEVSGIHPISASISLEPWQVSPNAPYPQVHTLTNGNYSLLITAAGGGFSRWKDTDLTRWQADSTLDDWGQWLYVQDKESGRLWSATYQPTASQANSQEVRFYPYKVEMQRHDDDIALRQSITISAESDVEIRQLTFTNHGDNSRVLALTSYSEVILASQSVDQRHPAFNKLFIESEYLPEERMLIFHRRPRSPKEEPLYMAHFITSNYEHLVNTGYETDRARFIGRGGSPRFPANLQNDAELRHGDGANYRNINNATLDTICALQAEIAIPPYETAQLAFITLTAPSRKAALELAQRYRRWGRISRTFEEARAQAERELRKLNISSLQLEYIQKLLSALLYPTAIMRADSATLSANTLSQPGLWSFSVSGDYPILLVRLKSEKNLDLLIEILQAHTYWRRRGLMIDLVIFNERETSYEQDFTSQIRRMLDLTNSTSWINLRGGIFIVREDQMNEQERILLATAARVVLDGDAGPLASQLEKLDRVPVRLPHFTPIKQSFAILDSSSGIKRPDNLLFDNGLGGFSPDGREYVIHLSPGQWTPAPWCNVIATPDFGFLVSESGLGCTWAQNSGENRLTPWRNDPVRDTPSEAIYLRDEDTGQIWSPTPLPVRTDVPYLIRHGTGYSIFEHTSHGLEHRLRLFAATHDPVKIVQLKIHNTTSHMRRINVTYFAEWVLGTSHEQTAQYIIPEFSHDHYALLARNPYNQDFGQHVAFLASTRELHGVTTDRNEFLGPHGSFNHPAALERVGLTPRVEPGSDPCAAVQLLLWLAPGETKEVTFLLGQGVDHADAKRLIEHYQDINNVKTAWQAVGEFWDEILEQVQVKTPDSGMDLLLNRWLLYQSLTCRIWGRTAFYQSSGAYGFRDQLQDVMALGNSLPEIEREHILRSASHQFEEGDVLHWWHPPAGRGIRTLCSDNLIWLPFVTAHYIKTTGDTSILSEPVSFLSAEPLKQGEHERYGQFPSVNSGTLYDHCCRALAKGVTAGVHGIPLIGAHDWNDGMSAIGKDGKGESIWLGWFIYATLNDFAEICEQFNDPQKALNYRAQAASIQQALELNGWDDEWYRRAYFDDGTPLGSAENSECQIDSIAQSWSVISGAGNPERARQSMESVYKKLVRPDNDLVLLYTPPFDRSVRDPGYIKGYPPGIRENGGQYTHAAIWAIWAFAELGQVERAYKLFDMINPIHHSDTAEKAALYRVEPYVVAADIYSVPPHTGRGGWTWYTGSASWMYRLGIEKILGLQRKGNELLINPCIPIEWKDFEISYRFGKSTYRIKVDNSKSSKNGSQQIKIDNKTISDAFIPLKDDGIDHIVDVILG